MKHIPNILLGIEDSRAYGRGLLRGVSQYARIHGPWLFRTRPEFYHGGSRISARLADLRNARFDGVITRELNRQQMQAITRLGVPVIVASHMTLEPSLPNIMTDCEAIGRMAARHFLERGFRHFGYCGLTDMFWSGRREVSFTAVIREAGYDVHPYLPPRAKRDRLWGREQFIMAKWLGQLPRPVAVMACTDDRARDLVEACELAGLNVPEDVAILGVDNDRLVCDLAGVPISSIALNTEQAGFEAAEWLAQLMAGQNVRQRQIVVSATHVEVRRSTDILAIEDRHVAKAIHYINAHANDPLQVAEVAREVGLSERHLYDRFHRALGRSIHEQITMARVARICWLLENTTMSVLEIALKIGLPDDKHLSRYFRRHQGIPPAAWRKKRSNPVTALVLPNSAPGSTTVDANRRGPAPSA